MNETLLLLADLWMTFVGLVFGWRFIRRHDNYLLGLEWIVVGVSGTNVLAWFLLGGHLESPQVWLMFFFDAFSRSIGFTLILVLGLMQVTHRYKPSPAIDVGVFIVAFGAGLYLQQFRYPEFDVGPATFYMIVNAPTTAFLIYFSWRLWQAGARSWAVIGWLATAAGTTIALMDDFLRIPGDDAYRTTFYTLALTVWGAQLFVYYTSYRRLGELLEGSEVGIGSRTPR